MANVNGVNADLIATHGTENLLTRGQQDSGVFCMSDTYETSATAANTGILMGGVLPKGARIKAVETAYDNIYSGGSSVLRVGDSADDDRYQTITVTAAGETTTVAIDGRDYVVGTTSGDNQIIIKATGTSAATGTIKVAVYYTQA
jgi:hypothetical protein